MNAQYFEQAFATTRAMVILRGFEVEPALALVRRAWSFGISVVEIPVQAERDFETLQRAAQEARALGRDIGAGTVTSADLVQRAAAAGAAFTVAPGLDADVVHASHAAGLAHLPGVATATEVHHARKLGCQWQKAFPAGVLGAGWFTAMHGPFPQVCFVATGGIDTANANQFLDAGAASVSFGSSFADASAAELRRVLDHGSI